jgi:hypothetical protein
MNADRRREARQVKQQEKKLGKEQRRGKKREVVFTYDQNGRPVVRDATK